MTGRLSGKAAVVTGGTRGIGRAITEAFLAEGAKVTIVGTDEQSIGTALADIGESERLGGIATDFSRDSSGSAVIAKALDNFSRIDVLINNAGLGSFQGPFELTSDEWERVFNVNLTVF